jgi:hypothetical protein
MKKVTKAIKLVNGFSDEEKQEFAEFFKTDEPEKKEETKVEEKVEVKEEEKVETKEEPKKEEVKEEEKKVDFEELFNKLQTQFTEVVKEVKILKEQKVEQVGVKAKPKGAKDGNAFEDIFAKLTQGQ